MSLSSSSALTGRFRLVLVLCAFVAGLPLPARAQWVLLAPDTIGKPTIALAESVGVFAAGIRSQQLQSYRRELRRDGLVRRLHALVANTEWTDGDLAEKVGAIDATVFLCEPNWQQQRVAVHLAAVEALGATLADRSKAPTDDLLGLLKTLGTTYSISLETVRLPGTFTSWLGSGNNDPGTPEGARCRRMIMEADPFATRQTAETNAGGLASGLALMDTVWSLLRPVVTSTLKTYDAERRAAALKDFFSSPAAAELKADVIAVESFVDAELTLHQERVTGRAVAAEISLSNTSSGSWSDFKTVARAKDCLTALSRLSPDATATTSLSISRSDPVGVMCFDRLLLALKLPLYAALDAADAFDLALAQSLPSREQKKRLSDQIDTLGKIARGATAPDPQVLWSAALNYLALFQTVENAGSKDSLGKVKLSWEAFQKAIGSAPEFPQTVK